MALPLEPAAGQRARQGVERQREHEPEGERLGCTSGPGHVQTNVDQRQEDQADGRAHALWFLGFLFSFSILCLPLFVWLRGDSGRQLTGRLARLCRRRGVIVLFFVPLALVRLALQPLFLHQPVIIILAYYVVQWPLSLGVKLPFVVAGSFCVTLGIYEFLIRRIAALRLVFGVKQMPAARAAR